MQKINFQDLPSTTTPINSTNLNAMQTNAENAINEITNTLGTITTQYDTKEIASSGEAEVVTISLQAGHTYIVSASADVGDNINSIMNLQMYIKSGTTVSNYIPRNSRTTGQAGGGLNMTGFFQCQTNCVIGCSCYNYDSSSHTYRCYIGAIQLK